MSADIIALPTSRTARPYAGGRPATPQSMPSELRRARIRIAQLEAALAKAMKDSLMNFDRARAAERKLYEVTGNKVHDVVGRD